MRNTASPGSPILPASFCWPTWTVALVAVVSTVIGTVTHPAGGIAEGCPLARLEEDAFHTQAEIAAAVGGAWWRECGSVGSQERRKGRAPPRD